MAEQNNNSNRITFKVKHLDEYHDIVIDVNADRYKYKHQQQPIFEQLESITGVPSRYTTDVIFHRNIYPSNAPNALWVPMAFYNQIAFVPNSVMGYGENQDISMVNLRDGERFHIQYYAHYDHFICKRISFRYVLVAERDVPEEGCNRHLCQYQCTASYFKKLKDLVCNDALNEKIDQLVLPLLDHYLLEEEEKIFSEFNIKQYLYPACLGYFDSRQTRFARRFQVYLRTQG
ncbi:uncharacterized protein LOC107365471 [Tetranychus urticae]|uniref:uncharacterized protein LOC107365471 n=1 Tax=Tetranychus urticae TaxID=32264 RepID=UPI00077B987E|nr:uncharacterized protein LOC107365471 [Tetranychus urticae]